VKSQLAILAALSALASQAMVRQQSVTLAWFSPDEFQPGVVYEVVCAGMTNTTPRTTITLTALPIGINIASVREVNSVSNTASPYTSITFTVPSVPSVPASPAAAP
jgi:hypothetical protein